MDVKQWPISQASLDNFEKTCESGFKLDEVNTEKVKESLLRASLAIGGSGLSLRDIYSITTPDISNSADKLYLELRVKEILQKYWLKLDCIDIMPVPQEWEYLTPLIKMTLIANGGILIKCYGCNYFCFCSSSGAHHFAFLHGLDCSQIAKLNL